MTIEVVRRRKRGTFLEERLRVLLNLKKETCFLVILYVLLDRK